MKNRKTLIMKPLLLIVVLALSVQLFSQSFVHPGLLHTQEDFDRIKAQLAANDPAVVAGYINLKSSEWAQLRARTWPSEIIKRGVAGDENYINAARGAHIAYMCALRWKISGDVAYANKAVEVLNLWAATTTGIGGNSNYALASGIYGYEFANAGELLRDYEGWDRADFKAYQDWMQTVWYPVALGFLKYRNNTNPGHYWSNWGLCNAMAITCIGVLCDDLFIYNQGLSYYKHDYIETFKEDKTGDDHIINDGYNEFIGNLVPIVWDDARGPFGKLGQMQESGRDQGHTLMALGLATDICQVAWSQGEDLYAYMDNRLAAGIEYVAAYNSGIENEDLPWKNYWYHDVRTTIENSWKQTENNDGGRGQHRPIWDRILGYYEGIMGVSMPYSTIMSQSVKDANSGADFGGVGSVSGGYDHLGYSTLTCTRPAITSNQAQTALGNTILFDGEIHQSSAVLYFQPGSVLTLTPTLPDTVINTGNWLWDTGETSQNLQITADSSNVYRVSYTNINGIVSTQMFSVAVYGDCNPDVYAVSVTSSNGVSEDTVLTVKQNSKVIMSVKSFSGYSSYLWNTGETTYSKKAFVAKKDTSFSITAINEGGAEYSLNFHITIDTIGAGYKIGDKDLIYGEKVLSVKGSTLTLIPDVKAGLDGGTWLWSDGSTTQNITLDNVQEKSEVTVTYTLSGTEYTLTYSIVPVDNESSFAYWPMDEGTGSIVYDIWAGNDGDMSENVWTNVGARNGGIRLNGGDASYVKLGNDLFGTLNDFTISVWVKPDALETWSRIWDFGTNTSYNMFLTPISGDGYVRFAIKAGGSEQQINTSRTLAIGKWSHITVTKSGNTAKLYVNGVLAGTNTGMTLNPSDLGFTALNYIGKSQYADPMLEGTIDELRMYNKALSQSEIMDMIQDVEPYETGYELDGDGLIKDSNIAVIAGQSVEFTPVLKPGMKMLTDLSNITWLWDNGETTPSLLLENIQESQDIVVIYMHEGTEYSITYTIILKPAENALGYWPMDETDGSVVHDVWSGNNGDLNATVWTADGKSNGGILFDGSASSYVKLPDNFMSTLNDFTIAVWVKPNALDTWSRIWDFGASTDYNMFLTPISGDGYVRFAIKAGGTEQQITTTETIPVNTWAHMVVTKSGNTASIYINGTLVASNTSTTLNPSDLGTTTQNYVGKSQWPDPIFNGAMDELQIFKTAFSQADITQLMAGVIPTSIPSNSTNAAKFSIFPTVSTSGNYTITSASNMGGKPFNVSIYDITGTLVKQFSVASDKSDFQLSESQLYIIKVNSGNTINTIKIIKK